MKILTQNLAKKISPLLIRLLVFIVVFSAVLSTHEAYASLEYGTGRIRSCDSSGKPDGLDFDPTTGGQDVDFVLSNPYCIAMIAVCYGAVKTSIAAMNAACGSGSPVPRVMPSPFMDAADIARATGKLGTPGPCGPAYSAAVSSFGVALGYLGITYAVANVAYKNTNVCGSKWVGPDPDNYLMDTPSYKQEVQNTVETWMRDNPSKMSLTEKTYREWYYGGVEIEDAPDTGETCYDVTVKENGEYPKQKYYMKGLETANYNCKKYNIFEGQNDPLTGGTVTSQRLAELQQAYKCCRERSSKYICIEYDPQGSLSKERRFCKAGTNCTLRAVTYSAKSLDNGRFVCAESYSLCPYNFTVGGGAEVCQYFQDGKYDDDEGRWVQITADDIANGNCSSKSVIRNADCTYNEKAGKCENYCQYMQHCTKTSSADFQYESGLTSPYFSYACLNFIGDSQNKTSYNTGFILGSQKHFSAPIAQCVKETLENVFYNRAGHTKCRDVYEKPSADGTCATGQYAGDGTFVHKLGNKVKQVSFFTTIQNTLQDVVKLVLTLSVMFYGMNILIGKANIGDKKDILVYILKIGLVLYFATGDAWQGMFFNGVYGASSQFAMMVFKIDAGTTENKRDGCQFGMITQSDGTEISSGRLYPAGKEYLAIWDTLDCKIMRYLGFGPEVSTANIFSLILAGYFTGAIGIYFAMAVMFFGFFFIAATIRALHIFLSSCISIIIMVFISPIIIPCALFAKTNSIFKNWMTNLIAFCLQPMILFAYIAVFVTVMDKTLIGSATFVGGTSTPFKSISCSDVCKNSDGTIVPYTGDVAPACDEPGQKMIDPESDSVACMININSFGKFPGLELIGVSIPILLDVLTNNPKAKVLTMLKAFLVMYLLYKFMDEIPGITKALIGGAELPASKTDAMGLFKKVVGFVTEAQKRINRGINKHAGGYAKGKLDQAKKMMERRGNQGKGVSEANRGSNETGKSEDGGNESESSDGGGDDSDSSGGGNESEGDK